MARIESLPFDVVHTVLAHLGPGDLPAVALVCHLFCAVATPRIYAHVRYTPRLAKQHGQIVSPFDLLVARPELLAHLKSLDIRALPLYKGTPHPQFTRACLHVVACAPFLASFTWSSASPGPSLLPTILPLLAARQADSVAPTRLGPVDRPPLARLAITDDCLSPSDAQLIPRLGPVENIALHKPSTGAIRALVDWIAPSSDSDLSNTRVHALTLSHAHALQPDSLARILGRTPNLRSLNITDSVHMTHTALFCVLVQVQPVLESLSFTVFADWIDADFPPIPTLRHVTVTINPPEEPTPDRFTNAPADPLTQRLLRKMLNSFPQATLHSMTVRLSSHRSLTDKVVKLLITQHGPTLRRLNLFKLGLSAAAVGAVLRRIPTLEQLSVELPLDEIDTLIGALAYATHLHTLIDTSPIPTTASTRAQPGRQPRLGKTSTPKRGLTRVQAGQLLLAGPVLVSIMSQGRNWTKEHEWSSGRCETVVSMRRMRMAGH
ncbi:F-box-like protein [Ceratobasidium sp. AG-Ba]|nr:F-box-like protein [Ceratobasidium sp. AG-Ba]